MVWLLTCPVNPTCTGCCSFTSCDQTIACLLRSTKIEGYRPWESVRLHSVLLCSWGSYVYECSFARLCYGVFFWEWLRLLCVWKVMNNFYINMLLGLSSSEFTWRRRHVMCAFLRWTWHENIRNGIAQIMSNCESVHGWCVYSLPMKSMSKQHKWSMFSASDPTLKDLS